MDFLAFSRPVVLILVFLGMVILVGAGMSYLSSYRAVRRRVAAQLETGGAVSARSLRSEQANSAWVRLVNFIEKRGLSLADSKGDQLRKRMIAAGYTHPAAPRMFTLVRLILTLAIPAALVTYMFSSAEPPSFIRVYLYGAGSALAGLYLPNLWISAKADRRKTALLNGLPDALDLMLVCVEAGLGIEAAFDRVGREMTRSHPLLAEMLGTVVLELRGGRSREDALRRMADRAGVDELRAFSTLLIQSGKLGSSIADTLRIYASEMREKRRLRAEEKAHKLPVLISLPLVGCMLPVMIGVLMLPAVIRVIRSLMPALGS
jgi:tight adherence protein C